MTARSTSAGSRYAPTGAGGGSRRLVNAAKDEAVRVGAPRIVLRARIALVSNVALFRRHGFVVTEEQTHEGFSAPTSYEMELSLPQ